MKEQQESARRVLTQATCIVNDELNRLNRELESKTYLIKVKDDLIERARADRDCANRLRKQAYKRAEDTLILYWLANTVAGALIAYVMLMW